MAIDWNDNTRRKAFRQALQEVYPSNEELEMFVDEELNENLATVAGDDKLQVTAFSLVKWAKAKGKLDEVYEAFKRENAGHAVIEKIERQSLISQTFNLTQDDWDTLFEQFRPDDQADLRRAFRRGFKQALGVDFQQAQCPPLVEPTQIRELLEKYDTDCKGPVLAVRFVEFAIAELRRSNKGTNRNLTPLEQWRDRITQQFDVPPPAPASEQTKACHAYLLVALEEHGSDVNVYPELRITGIEKPIRFGAKPTTCPVDAVADWISKWIHQAEEVLEANTCDDEEVTLEVFLPCQHLEEDIATTWSIKDKRGGDIALGTYRRLLIRSSDRIRDRQIQRTLTRRWTRLEEYIRENNACNRLHLQEDCPTERGILRALLEDEEALGLKFVAQLPTDLDRRTDLLYEIIDAAIPIALWSCEEAKPNTNTLITEFDALLNSCHHLTNFAELARRWRMRRLKSTSAKYIRLLCDRPDRLPRLPDLENREDEDAIVAC